MPSRLDSTASTWSKHRRSRRCWWWWWWEELRSSRQLQSQPRPYWPKFQWIIYWHHWNHTMPLLVPEGSDSTSSWIWWPVFFQSCSRYKVPKSLNNFKNTQKPCDPSQDEKLNGHLETLLLCGVLPAVNENFRYFAEKNHEERHSCSTCHCGKTPHSHQHLVHRIRIAEEGKEGNGLDLWFAGGLGLDERLFQILLTLHGIYSYTKL